MNTQQIANRLVDDKGRRFDIIFWLFSLFLVFIMTGCDSKKDFKLLYSEKSPNGLVELQVYSSEAMSFGPHNIKIFAQVKEGSEKLILDERLFNDGIKLRKSNVVVEWKDQTVTISFNGQEQDIKTYNIDLNTLK